MWALSVRGAGATSRPTCGCPITACPAHATFIHSLHAQPLPPGQVSVYALYVPWAGLESKIPHSPKVCRHDCVLSSHVRQRGARHPFSRFMT
jgi:hypothetical protein